MGIFRPGCPRQMSRTGWTLAALVALAGCAGGAANPNLIARPVQGPEAAALAAILASTGRAVALEEPALRAVSDRRSCVRVR